MPRAALRMGGPPVVVDEVLSSTCEFVRVGISSTHSDGTKKLLPRAIIIWLA